MPRGGKREGSGRPKTNRQTTKATIYLEDRELLNAYAESLGIPVNELIHRLIRNEEFKALLNKLTL
jgi:hypothetical protein